MVSDRRGAWVCFPPSRLEICAAEVHIRVVTRIGLAVIALALLAGCVPPVSVVYVPDPSAPIAGWKCPSDKQFIAHTNPPCTWIPGVVLTASCRGEYIRHINEARGCVPQPTASAAATPRPVGS